MIIFGNTRQGPVLGNRMVIRSWGDDEQAGVNAPGEEHPEASVVLVDARRSGRSRRRVR
jgi:hypothetical protein